MSIRRTAYDLRLTNVVKDLQKGERELNQKAVVNTINLLIHRPTASSSGLASEEQQ